MKGNLLPNNDWNVRYFFPMIILMTYNIRNVINFIFPIRHYNIETKNSENKDTPKNSEIFFDSLMFPFEFLNFSETLAMEKFSFCFLLNHSLYNNPPKTKNYLKLLDFILLQNFKHNKFESRLKKNKNFTEENSIEHSHYYGSRG